MPKLPERIVSGGQTGVDRAALDVALELGLPCGGFCPRGRRAEDGVIPERYPLRELASREYPPRTARNVRESDGTLILHRRRISGGTALTLRLAQEKRRPCRVVDLAARPDAAEVGAWIEAQGIRVLNVAGPRESEAPGIHDEAVRLLRRVLRGPGA